MFLLLLSKITLFLPIPPNPSKIYCLFVILDIVYVLFLYD